MYVDYQLRRAGRSGLTSDSDFVRRVYSNKFGTFGRNNSASWDVVHRVCKSFGVNCRYSNKGKQSLIAELDKNGMSCINIWHHGLTRSTRGGGHVVAVAGYDKEKGFLIYDPWGSKPSTRYSDTKKGIYWMPESEFDWRWQSIFTAFIGLV